MRRLLRRLRRVSPQILRHAIQISVVVFIVYAALGGPWRNFKRAHNSRRLVTLMEGENVGKAYGMNEDFLSLFGKSDEVSLAVLGMPWAGTVFGIETTDPMLVLGVIAATGSVTLSLLFGLLLPLGMAALLGKVFCSHLCPARLVFEVGQSVRRGLARLEIRLPALKPRVRLGGWVMLGGFLGTLLGGITIWLLLLPYVALSAGLFLFVTTGAATALLGIMAFWFAVDLFVAPGLWCRALCPTGFLLENVGRWSLFRLVQTRADDCPKGCTTCIDACPYHLSPRDMTHDPICDRCGACTVNCPKEKLGRRLVLLPSKRALPVVSSLAMLFAVFAAAPADAHHNKGLPHYGYYENYPQVPTEEYIRIQGRYEIGATVFNFQGLERRNAETPNDVKIYLYVYDLEADGNYRGAIDFTIVNEDGEAVSKFTRAGVDEEAIYSTRETLPASGEYKLVAKLRDADNVELSLGFYIDLAVDRVNWTLVAAIALPALLIFALAAFGRSRRIKKRRARAAAVGASMSLLLLLATPALATGPASQPASMPASQPAAKGGHACGHGGMKMMPATAPEVAPEPTAASVEPEKPKPTPKRKPKPKPKPEAEAEADAEAEAEAEPEAKPASGHACGQGGHMMMGSSADDHDMLHKEGEGHNHGDAHAGHGGMKHYKTEDGGEVMVMAGIPTWLFLVGIGGVILLSFVVVEGVGIRSSRRRRKNLIKNKHVYRFMKSRWIQAVPQLLNVALFFFLIIAGLFGSAASNITPVAVWTVWWGGLIFAVVLIGPAFCFACPWDGLSNLMSRLRLAARVEPLSLGLRYPSWLRNLYPAILLFAGLTWLELGMGVTTSPRSTAYMGIGMGSLAVVCALLFDGKRFCAHFCPVGRIQGIYAGFAPLEIRARNPNTCAKACKTEDCLHGNDKGYACPVGISLKIVDQPDAAVPASQCTFCTECIKSCGYNNVALNVRPFGAGFDGLRRGRIDEAWLALSLLALTLFHGFSMTSAWEAYEPGKWSLIRWLGTTLGTPKEVSFTIGMIGAMALPVALYWLSVWLGARWANGLATTRDLFVRYATSLLPVALFYHLAHNAMHLFAEGPKVVPMLSDPMGTGADWFGTADMHPGALMSDQALWFLQVGLILVGHVFGIVVAHRIGKNLYEDRGRAVRSLVPMLVMMIIVSVCGLGLMHLDMNMRVGRM
jgi:polyferredoxin